MDGTIIRTEVSLLGIDLPRPFPLGFGTLNTLPRVIYIIDVEQGDCFVRGVGEASIDFPFTDYDAWDVYSALSTLDLKGRNIADREELLADITIRTQLLTGFPAAFAAFNMALDDAFGRVFGLSVIDLYGQKREAGSIVVSLPFFEKERDLLLAMDDNHRKGVVVKPKVGQGFDNDLLFLLAMGRHLRTGPLQIILDFNATYSLDGFLQLLEALNDHGFPWETVMFIEQPTHKDAGIGALIEVRRWLESEGIYIGVMADESFVTLDDAIACTAGDILLNFKIHKIGGIWVAREIENALGSRLGPTMVGGTFPTAIGRTWDQQAAAVLRSATLPSDGWQPSTDWFDGHRHLIREQFRRTEAGRALPFRREGLGVSVAWENLMPLVIPDPRHEYQRIRQGQSGERLQIVMKPGLSYKTVYEQRSGRAFDWNL